jgi:hypothetical protein
LLFKFLLLDLCRRSRLQEVRTWIKNSPTYSMPLMNGAWQVLDAPVIKEIDRSTKSFYAVKFLNFLYFSLFIIHRNIQ